VFYIGPEATRESNMVSEVEVERFDLSKFTVTVEYVKGKYYLVVRRKLQA